MRHVDLTTLLSQIFATQAGKKVKKSLETAEKKVAKKRVFKTRKKYIDKNGGIKWRPIKDHLVSRLGQKCWYSEHELIGAPLAIDHYRPVYHYWWLAFDAENYRVACAWVNSPVHNAQHGCVGGKGENFPLLHASFRATKKSDLPNERPIILDPCNSADCEMLAFEVDGRPVLNPNFVGNADATERVNQSKILLNLDHPDFNTKREQLCRDIKDDVTTYEALPAHAPERVTVQNRIKRRIAPNASFSTAALFYLKLHRHLTWVENIVNPLPSQPPTPPRPLPLTHSP